MHYIDSDPTYTDWHEFAPQNKPDRCPITGVFLKPDHLADRHFGDEENDNETERREKPNSKLKAMFDKFLYQR